MIERTVDGAEVALRVGLMGRMQDVTIKVRASGSIPVSVVCGGIGPAFWCMGALRGHSQRGIIWQCLYEWQLGRCLKGYESQALLRREF